MISLSDRRFLLVLLTLFATLLIFNRLEGGGLPSYDDAYYAQKAKQMIATGDYFTAYLGPHKMFDNPPGFFWLISSSFKLLGVSEFSARFPAALAGVLSILMTFLLFELLFTTRVGFLAAFVLLSTTVFLKYARHAMMDTNVTLFVLLTFYGFHRAIRGSSAWFIVAGVLGSMIMFMKSAFGVLPLATLFVYLLATRQWTNFKRPALWLGLVLYVTPYGYWVWNQYSNHGQEFLAHYQLIRNMSQNSGADRFYDYAVVMLWYFPLWLPFFFIGGWRALKAQAVERTSYWFPLIYFAIFFTVLSSQGTTKTWYFLSTFPACAALAALGLDQVLKRYSQATLSKAVTALAVVVFFVMHLSPVRFARDREKDIRQLGPYVRAAAQNGFVRLAYGFDYFGLNNALLFYSDHDADPVNDTTLPDKLREGQKTAMILFTKDWERLKPDLKQFSVFKRTANMVLVTTEPLPSEEVF